MDEKYFNGLNESQCEAIRATEGFVRIIAGAGSGKTKVLTNRYAYIVEKLGIDPSNILCVTFTNRAAREMKQRIELLLDVQPTNDFICTFHGFCVRVLREHIPVLNYPRHFSIIDEEDQKSILREVYGTLGIDSKTKTLQEAIKQIGQYKADKPEPYIETAIVASDPVTPAQDASNDMKIISEYIRLQKRNFSLDFEDLINFTLYIFKQYPDILKRWQSRFEYIMVDETQDSSTRQWFLADALSGMSRNLFVVGDPDQSIYEWRGARPEYLVRFDQNHTPCTTIILNQNYRSCQQILDVANSIITNNTVRVTKTMFTENHEPTTVIHYHAKSDFDESLYVARKIKEKINAGESIDNIAILFRVSFLSRSFEQALVRQEIPYIIYGGIRFFERKEIKDALAYLKLVAIEDDISFLRVINTPNRKLGKVFINNLKEIAERESLSLYAALKTHILENDKRIDRDTAREFLTMIESIKSRQDTMNIAAIAQEVLEASGLIKAIRQDGDEERLDNINELMRSIEIYEKSMVYEEHVSLAQYLQDIALYTNIDYKKDDTFLKLLTIHQSKGLEFDTVFVVGMSEGIFPSHRSIRERGLKALEEERRLAYVAITRARKELYLTESEGFSYETSDKCPSRFIYEITEGLLKIEGKIPRSLEQKLKTVAGKRTMNNHRETGFSIRDRVTHPYFGNGTVVSVDYNHYSIYFDILKKEKLISKTFPDLSFLSGRSKR
ncbi:putative ATP-dependent DNA helicase UvrD/PcrA [Pillotina sp. SPG140]|jgi:DNA helicase-2/ATP-dependent DNA helicase PcrA